MTSHIIRTLLVNLEVSKYIVLLMVVILSACGGSGGGAGDSTSSGISADVTITGVVTYEDKEYGSRGFTSVTEYKTLRHAVIDLVDFDGSIIATTTTDENGFYELAGAGYGLYVRVLAKTGSGAGSTITIRNHNGEAYGMTQSLGGSNGTVSLDMAIGGENTIVGAYNMLDVFASASLFVSSLSTSSLPAVNIYWQSASSNYGTYFCPSNFRGGSCPQGTGIYILGGSSSGGDTDEFDDDVLMHEYAHYIEVAVGAKDSPGGRHYLTDNDHDLRLAWSEGWGGFFPNALKTWMVVNDPDRLSTEDNLPNAYFIDTYGTFASISINMASPNPWFCPGGIDCFVYTSSEISVAKVLSEIQDDFGINAIWNVYSNYMSSGTSNPATLETFWDGWLQQRSPASDELTDMRTILDERLINFVQDESEDNDSIASAKALAVCTASPCSSDKNYLYKNTTSSDIDIFSFAVTAGETYLIETLELSNAADTYLRLLDGSGSQVFNGSGAALINDDRPGTSYCYQSDNPCRIHYDDSMLSSSISFTPTSSGTFYVEVKSSPERPVGAGRYGTYSIRVSSQ